MENFVVSARKYRPSTFDSVIGQEHITHTLKNALRNNQLAHAFLFCGPRGVGKTTCARILAKTINCLNVTPDFEPCNECESCKAFNGNGSFNIYELDAASNNSVEDIRGLVEQVRYPPQGAKFKVYIIDEVHMLSSQAFNAFLKTLEEPPPYAKFILATTERHKILPTILSRCQVFDFHRISIEDAVKQLKEIVSQEGLEVEEEALHEIAQKADGAMRDALSIFDRIVSSCGKKIVYQDVISNLNILDHGYYFTATDKILNRDVPGMLNLFDEVLAKGFDVQHFVSGFSEHIRNLLVCRYPNTVKLLEVAPSISQKYIDQSNACSETLLMNALNLLNKCELEYKSSKNQRLHVELTLLKLCHILSIVDLLTEANKKKISDQPIVVQTEPVVLPEPKINIYKVEEKPVPPINRNNGTSRLDKLKQKINSGETSSSDIIDQLEPEKVDSLNLKSLTTENFTEQLSIYLNELSQSGKMSIATIYKNSPYHVKDDVKVELTLASIHEREMYDEDRTNLIPFMRKTFGSEFDILIQINVQANNNKVFTAEEKFKLMAEKNPALIEMKNLLGLELE